MEPSRPAEALAVAAAGVSAAAIVVLEAGWRISGWHRHRGRKD